MLLRKKKIACRYFDRTSIKINKTKIQKKENLGGISSLILQKNFWDKYFTQQNTKFNKSSTLANTTQKKIRLSTQCRVLSARLENTMAARAPPSPLSPCVRTAMANDAIPNFSKPRPFRGPTLAASIYNVCPGSEQIVSVGYDLHVRSLPQVYVYKYSRLS